MSSLRCVDGEISPWPFRAASGATSATRAQALACIASSAWERACAWAALTRPQTWALVDTRGRYVHARDLARAARRVTSAGLAPLACGASEDELRRASVLLARGEQAAAASTLLGAASSECDRKEKLLRAPKARLR